MLHTSDFDFDLPSELIASHPLHERDASRMLVVDGQDIADKHIRDFVSFYVRVMLLFSIIHVLFRHVLKQVVMKSHCIHPKTIKIGGDFVRNLTKSMSAIL